MHQWLQGFAFRTGIAWWIYPLAAIAAILIAFLTVCFYSVKAANADPADSLRTE